MWFLKSGIRHRADPDIERLCSYVKFTKQPLVLGIRIGGCSLEDPFSPQQRELDLVALTDGSFRIRGTLFGALIIRIPVFRVLYSGPLFSETPR